MNMPARAPVMPLAQTRGGNKCNGGSATPFGSYLG